MALPANPIRVFSRVFRQLNSRRVAIVIYRVEAKQRETGEDEFMD